MLLSFSSYFYLIGKISLKAGLYLRVIWVPSDRYLCFHLSIVSYFYSSFFIFLYEMILILLFISSYSLFLELNKEMTGKAWLFSLLSYYCFFTLPNFPLWIGWGTIIGQIDGIDCERLFRTISDLYFVFIDFYSLANYYIYEPQIRNF